MPSQKAIHYYQVDFLYRLYSLAGTTCIYQILSHQAVAHNFSQHKLACNEIISGIIIIFEQIIDLKKEKYQYKSEGQFEYFEFYSEGPKGVIKKVVEFQKTIQENVYNLAFGDYSDEAKGIDDLTVTNNGDGLKILATVASTVYAFTEKRPEAWIIATGSTAARTRLYRMGITNNLAEISADFIIFGYSKNEIWVPFEIGEDYEAFLVTKKENKF